MIVELKKVRGTEKYPDQSIIRFGENRLIYFTSAICGTEKAEKVKAYLESKDSLDHEARMKLAMALIDVKAIRNV